MGFASSHSAGFWEALTQAIAEQRVANEERAAAERAEQARQVFADAAKNGRRVEETWGPITLFQEFIPPASGDIVDDQTQLRTGEIVVEPSGKATVITKYWNGSTQVGVVVSVIEGRRRDGHQGERVRARLDRRQGGRLTARPGAGLVGRPARSRTRSTRRPTGASGRPAAALPLEQHRKTSGAETIVRATSGSRDAVRPDQAARRQRDQAVHRGAAQGGRPVPERLRAEGQGEVRRRRGRPHHRLLREGRQGRGASSGASIMRRDRDDRCRRGAQARRARRPEAGRLASGVGRPQDPVHVGPEARAVAPSPQKEPPRRRARPTGAA